MAFTAQECAAAGVHERPRRTQFHSKQWPSLTIAEYIDRISNFFDCSDECYVLSMMYMDRVVGLHPHVTIDVFSCHRMLLTSLVVAAKFHDDTCYSNKFYAKVGGVAEGELCSLEGHLLSLLDWQLCVTAQSYEQCRALLQEATEPQLQSSSKGLDDVYQLPS